MPGGPSKGEEDNSKSKGGAIIQGDRAQLTESKD